MQSDASLLVVFSDTDPDTLSLVGKGAELAQNRGLLCGAVLVAADLTSAEQEHISSARRPTKFPVRNCSSGDIDQTGPETTASRNFIFILSVFSCCRSCCSGCLTYWNYG